MMYSHVKLTRNSKAPVICSYMGVSMSDQGRTKVSELLQLFFRVISQFLPNLPSKLALFCKLLQNNAKWTWVRKQKEAFRAAKGALYDDSLLVHYDTGWMYSGSRVVIPLQC